MGEKQPHSNLAALSRVSIILDSTKQGKSYEEIQNNLKGYESKEAARGLLSVENVGRALSTLPFVTSVLETKVGGHEDVRELRDLIILLDNQSVEGVSIQVKSRPQAIIDFYKRFSPNQEKAKQILIKRKLIVLNGQIPDETIIKFFKDRLSEINNYFQTQPEEKRKFYFVSKSIRRKIK